jgi:hypothetical protein
MIFKHTFESRALPSPANADLAMFIHAELEVEGKHMHLEVKGEHGEPLEQRMLPPEDIKMINCWALECHADYCEHLVDMEAPDWREDVG